MCRDIVGVVAEELGRGDLPLVMDRETETSISAETPFHESRVDPGDDPTTRRPGRRSEGEHRRREKMGHDPNKKRGALHPCSEV